LTASAVLYTLLPTKPWQIWCSANFALGMCHRQWVDTCRVPTWWTSLQMMNVTQTYSCVVRQFSVIVSPVQYRLSVSA